MSTYKILFKWFDYDEDHEINVSAYSQADAYEKAMDALNWLPYAAYVAEKISKNGKVHVFSRNLYGMPYGG